tara:strand:- start:1233 stop:1400 length:168 start_codon:yes stop_codon:yes gene_type:complete
LNIYGDYRLCKKCGMKADVVENGIDLCAECWNKKMTGKTIDEFGKELDEKENKET